MYIQSPLENYLYCVKMSSTCSQNVVSTTSLPQYDSGNPISVRWTPRSRRYHCFILNSPEHELNGILTLKATKVVCFSRLMKCLRSLYGKKCGPRSAPIGAVCSGSTLFASILNYLQQTTAADDIFRCIFFLAI